MKHSQPKSQLAAARASGFTEAKWFISRYAPRRTAPELLEAISVGRERMVQNLLEKIADSASSGATHHVLLYGPRGIGKSHLISLLHHRLVSDDRMYKSVHIAWLYEAQFVHSLVQLLVRIYRSLCERYPSEYAAEWLDELLDQPSEDVESVLTRRLVARFETRKLVILVEDLNLLLENLGADGQHALRTLLQEHPFACLIATSQHLFRAISDRNEPFFGFFQHIPLKPLTFSDAQQLLVKIAEIRGQVDLAHFLSTTDGKGRVQAIYDLAGGNHLIFVSLSGYLSRETLDQLTLPFQRMLDELTPYYQLPLRSLSPLQQQIVEVLCHEQGTVNPKEIARRLLVDQRSIGKQVRLLEKSRYLTSTRRGRETFYELSEPLQRQAHDIQPHSFLQMLIEFLRSWYEPVKLKTADEGDNVGATLDNFDCCSEALTYYERVIECEPKSANHRFLRGEALFALHRWDEGFDSIREAFRLSQWDDLGNVASMFTLVFRLSEDVAGMQTRIGTLVNFYEDAKRRAATVQLSASPYANPLSHLGVGLVKSLGNFDADRITPSVLQSYFTAVEQRVAGLPELTIPLRLFRHGIRYLISGKESEFVALIHPERHILRQALRISV
jgi:DNA-binding MarR family transcriptional regulator